MPTAAAVFLSTVDVYLLGSMHRRFESWAESLLFCLRFQIAAKCMTRLQCHYFLAKSWCNIATINQAATAAKLQRAKLVPQKGKGASFGRQRRAMRSAMIAARFIARQSWQNNTAIGVPLGINIIANVPRVLAQFGIA